MREFLNQRVEFSGRRGVVVGIRNEVDFGPLADGTHRGVEPALRIIPNGEEDLEPIEVHPSRVEEVSR